MADDRWYKPGSFYRQCERTGFKVRAEHTKKEWTGRYVRDQSFELRQPQDFVRGRADNQTVPDPRPRLSNVFIGPNYRVTMNEACGYVFRITMSGAPRIIN